MSVSAAQCIALCACSALTVPAAQVAKKAIHRPAVHKPAPKRVAHKLVHRAQPKSTRPEAVTLTRVEYLPCNVQLPAITALVDDAPGTPLAEFLTTAPTMRPVTVSRPGGLTPFGPGFTGLPTLNPQPVGQPPTDTPDKSPPSVVPEPATWGLMLIGFGLVGAVVRMKKGVLA